MAAASALSATVTPSASSPSTSRSTCSAQYRREVPSGRRDPGQTDYRFVVSDKVREVFQNGNEYRRLHGKQLALPVNQADWPDKALLRWHNYERFLG